MTSKIADDLAYSVINTYRMKSGPNRVVKIWKPTAYGSVLLFKEFKIAICLYGLDREQSIRYLYLHEPPEKEVARAVLFDRFNALLMQASRPTLHEVVNDYWIFSDGVPWAGQRLFKWGERSILKTEKAILNDILVSHP